ncbi:hypothetical protein FNV43_RR02109 [Rhamnella rubrinervis]|uniref:Myb/SANT-like domain-containing protein n=1 Tax=Rhamnella rubrinervis TaxID=2594499 RepID=A0A8K0HRR1_9ROSA|nr:hypothetical protein FNV43_RR02109 [Rhamnella rubrinervis]
MNPFEDVDDDGKKEGIWSEKNEAIYIELMEQEVIKGNRSTTTFTKSSWNYIRNQLQIRCGHSYTHDQLKNKFHSLKRIYKEFKKLLKGTTGVGWNPALGTITLDDTVWDNLIKVNKSAKKFRKKGCPHYEKLQVIYEDTMATGEFSFPSTRIPSDSEDGNTINEMNVDGDGQEDKSYGMDKSEGNKNSSTSSRGTRRKRENISGALMSFINVYAESARKRNEILEHKVASSSSATSSTNDDGAVPSKRNDEDEDLLNQCFEILNTMDEIDGDSYSKAIKLLHDDVTWRKLFLHMPDKRKIDFIRSL